MSGKPIRLELALPAPSGALADLLDRQEQALYAAGVEDDVRQRARLVSEEVLSNILRHAAATRTWLDMQVDGDELRLCFGDDAGRFDPSSARTLDPATPLAQRQTGGLGLLLVERLSRAINYRRDAEGNLLEVLLDNDAGQPQRRADAV